MIAGRMGPGRGCNHYWVLDVNGYPDDTPVPSFGPRLRYECCGHLGADAQPNWQEMAGTSIFGPGAPNCRLISL